MFFSKCLLLSFAALAAVSSAIPIQYARGGLDDLTKSVDNTDKNIPAPPPAPRAADSAVPDQGTSLPIILITLNDSLGGVLSQFKSAPDAKSINTDRVTSLLGTVQTLLTTAVSDAKSLAGLDLNTILLTKTGKVAALLNLANIVASLLKTISDILAVVVFSLADGGLPGAIETLVANIIDLVCQLITIAFSTVDGLEAAVTPLVGTVLVTLESVVLPVATAVDSILHLFL